MKRLLLSLTLAMIATPALARDSLGMFGTWGAFRDPAVPRCYAIAMADAAAGQRRDYTPYADVSTWPRKGLRGVFHARLSRRIAPNAAITLSIGGQRFRLTGGGGDAWAADARDDAAITAAMRSAGGLLISARSAEGKAFTDSYALSGAATAMDAALLGCAGDNR